jgi:hypothetical protein
MQYIFTVIYAILLGGGYLGLDDAWIVYAALATVLFQLIYGIGRKAVVPEVISVFYIFTCLVMPLLGYQVYTRQNYLARIFRKYMLVQEPVYFHFALPAVMALVLALSWPSPEDSAENWQRILVRAKASLASFSGIGYQIIYVGLLSTLVSPFIPVAFRFFTDLFFFSSFAGVLYLFYSGYSTNKLITILLFVGAVFLQAINSGMFTVISYMGATIFSFFLLQNRSSLLTKLSFLLFGIFFLLVLQTSKTAFRKNLRTNKVDNKTELFISIVSEKSGAVNTLFNPNDFFPLYIRMNQGWNISKVMRYMPEIKPFDDGKRLGLTISSAFVPRFLWPDKPEAGGRGNMLYYANTVLTDFSTNIGPVGEAYGSFGPDGGVILMLLLGFFIRWVYLSFLKRADSIPLLVFWIPVLFYQTTYSAETDILQIFNSLIKTSFFLWLLYRFVPSWFGKKKLKDKG